VATRPPLDGHYLEPMRIDVEPPTRSEAYPFSHELRVRFAETDAMGIVHHSRYLPYLEAARVEYLRAIGHPYDELRKDGVDYAVLECFVQYRKPLYFDDLVDVHVAIAGATRASFQMVYLLTVAGEIRATAVTVHGCVNPQGRPVRMPQWLADLAVSPVTGSPVTGRDG
jgi:acyl-CoA thioester hydrolase